MRDVSRSSSRAERARQRDLHKYYQPWLGSSSLDNVPTPELANSHSNVQSSHDTTLIALAQLAALRLNVKRGIVSLIDKSTQIILAEATQTLSLVDESRHAPGDHLWLGNVSLPREQCIDEHVFGSRWTGFDAEGGSHTLAALVINEVEKDARFSHRDYVVANPGVKFYAGVPIVTNKGHEIGVYAVSDTKPRPEGLCVEQVQFMQDSARIVAGHLERTKASADRQRHDVLVRGIASFVDGLSAYKHELNSSVERPSRTSSMDDEEHGTTYNSEDLQATDPQPDIIQDQASTPVEDTKYDSQTADAPSNDDPHAIADTDTTIPPDPVEVTGPGDDMVDKNHDSIVQIFQRAANTIQESMGMTGCVFVDALPGLTANPDVNVPLPEADIQVPLHEPWDAEVEVDGATSESGPPSSSSIGNEFAVLSLSDSAVDPTQASDVLGASIRGRSTTSPMHFLSRKHLRRSLRRFPQGKIFYLGDRRGSEPDPVIHEHPETPMQGNEQRVLSVEPPDSKMLPRVLLNQIPGARWLIFLPLFNYAQGQWFSAGFIWSDNENVGDLEAAMPYLQTFGACIMSEVTSMEAINTNIAKSTFIASISHDLRSPLHGVLGSLELLESSLTTAYQASLSATISTCGKTLLDTIDHLLDFAKINNLNKFKPASRGASSGQLSSGVELVETTTFDVSLLLEEVVEAVFAGQTFRKTELHSRDAVDETIDSAHRVGADDSMTRDEAIYAGSAKFSGKVFIIISVDKTADGFYVQGQTGAVRRIILNIVGNAIKYSHIGSIEIGLRVEPKSESELDVVISVNDTGVGMSKEFQSKYLYTAFAQESSFSTGAGLGLSITAQIVRNLGGKIGIKSAKDSGTHVTITLPMSRAPDAPSDDDEVLAAARSLTSGKEICLLNPNDEDVQSENSRLSKLTASIARTCESWFDMKCTQGREIDETDRANIYLYCEPPPIEYLLQHHTERQQLGLSGRGIALLIICTNAYEAAALRAAGVSQLNALGHVVEVVSQPLGIRKLAKVLVASIQRLQKGRSSSWPFIHQPLNHEILSRGDTQARASQVEWNDTHLVYDTTTADYRPSIDTVRWKSAQPLTTLPGEETTYHGPNSILPSQPEIDPCEPLNPLARSRSQSSQSGSPTSYVLLVEDNAINLKLLATFMKKIKLPYAEAINGQEAYEKVQSSERPFDFILMDLQMPVMDGLEAARRIREYESQTKSEHRCFIIAITGVGSESTRKEAMSLGMDYFLTKPVRFKALQQILDQNQQSLSPEA